MAKYPDVFVVVNEGKVKYFDKVALDQFATAREKLRDFIE